MTPAAVLALVLAAAAKFGPDVIDAVEEIVRSLKEKHPELGDPPAADEEAALDSAEDAQLEKQFEAPPGSSDR